MADNFTHITGSEDGSLVNALKGIPPWATESTAFQIQSVLTKSFNIQKNGFAAMIKSAQASLASNNPDNKKVNDELEKYLRNITRNNLEDEKARRRKKTGNDLDEAASRKSSVASSLVSSAFTGLGALSAGVLNAQKQYIITSDSMFKSGINLIDSTDANSTSMKSLHQMITQTGLRLETLQKVAEKYSSSINAVGMMKFTKAVSAANTNLVSLGYSSEEGAELVGMMMEAESSYSDIRGKSTAEFADNAARMGKQLNTLSLTFGISNAKLQENVLALSKNSDSMAINAIYGADAAKNFNVFAGAMKDTNAGKVLQKLAASEMAEATQTFQELNKAGIGDIAQEMTRLSKAGMIDPLGAQKQLESLFMNLGDDRIKALNIQANAGNQSAQGVMELINGVRSQMLQVSKETPETQTKAEGSQAVISALKTEVEKFAGSLERTFPLLETQVVLATDALKLFNGGLDKINANVNTTAMSWIGTGVALAGVILSLGIFKIGLDALKGKLISMATGGPNAPNPARPTPGGAAARMGVGGALVRGAGVIGAGVIGYEIGQEIVAPLIDKLTQYMSGEKDKTLGTALYDMFNKDINQSSEQERLKTSNIMKNAGHSVPTNPKASEIISPSADTPSVKPVDTTSGTPSALPAVPNKTPGEQNSINMLNDIMRQQAQLLDQILQGTNKLVSTNGDILRYTRNQ